jgi:hypothetical protein
MHSVKAIKLLSEVRDNSSLTGNNKVSVSSNEGPDTTEMSSEIIVNLRTAANTDPESIVLDNNVMSICQDLLTYDEPNTDLSGDETIVERAVEEEEKEVERVERLSPQEKTALETEVETLKSNREAEVQQKVQAAQTLITEL